MCEYKIGLYAAIFLCCLICSSRNAALTDHELKMYKHLIEGQGLYSVDDDITILTAHNFKELIYDKKYATLIEFYNSWCGFCQRFAPSWKALGSSIRGWKDTINIAAMDCSDDDNAPVCREFEIMAYPTLRYIRENYEEGPGKIGDEITKGENVDGHIQNLIAKALVEKKDGRGAQFPNISPYSSSDLDDIFNGAPKGVKYVFLIIEQSDAPFIGPQVTFDLHNVANISVRYSLTNNTALVKNLKASNFPAIIVRSRDGSEQVLGDGLTTRESIQSVIRDFLKPRSIEIPAMTTMKSIFTGKWVDAEIPDMGALQEERERQILKRKIMEMGDVVFQADLETALRNSLRLEVALSKTISGEKLDALKEYVNVLVKYFPLGPKGMEFLNSLKDNVLAAGDSLRGADIAQWVSDAENEDQEVFSSPIQWLACRGSTPSYRGYPCGLWKMFHFLTVAAVEKNAGKPNAHPREVLDAMLGYIKHFFGCADCSRHFQQMAKEKDMHSVNSLDSAVLWLWMAHNSVNKRLSQDATEDPEYPKVQFPLPERCTSCKKSDNTWDYGEVLQYVKRAYSGNNVRYIGSDTRVLHVGLQGGSSGRGSSTYFFKKVDASMCLMIYLVSFILIVILIRMFLKRGYKKKMYVHDLLGKV